MTKPKQRIDLVLLGPPGAGKGTQADLLKKAYGLLHISTGEMLREAVKKGGDTGKEIQSYMNSGGLVPDEIVTKAVVERIGEPDAAGGVILDGYPRNLAQAIALDQALDKEARSLTRVLYFRTSEETAVQRLSGRRVCPKCGKNYHLTNIPPEKDGICDTCGVDLFQRDDDKPETVRKRLSVYQRETGNLTEYYKDKGLLSEVDGALPAEELFERIDDLFKREGLVDDDSDR